MCFFAWKQQMQNSFLETFILIPMRKKKRLWRRIDETRWWVHDQYCVFDLKTFSDTIAWDRQLASYSLTHQKKGVLIFLEIKWGFLQKFCHTLFFLSVQSFLAFFDGGSSNSSGSLSKKNITPQPAHKYLTWFVVSLKTVSPPSPPHSCVAAIPLSHMTAQHATQDKKQPPLCWNRQKEIFLSYMLSLYFFCRFLLCRGFFPHTKKMHTYIMFFQFGIFDGLEDRYFRIIIMFGVRTSECIIGSSQKAFSTALFLNYLRSRHVYCWYGF